MRLVSYFEKFVSNIQPSEERVTAVADAHVTLRRHLVQDADLKFVIHDSFLSGSYARFTATDPIKDADVIVLLQDAGLLNAARTEPRPREVLNDLKKAIDLFYDDVSLLSQRRSIRVTLPDAGGIRLDIVPAIEPYGRDRPLFVPDREQGLWLFSNPRGHLALTTELNKLSHGRYVRVVKALKWWNSRALKKGLAPCSFLLESIVSRNIDLSGECLCMVFENTVKAILSSLRCYREHGCLPSVPDPGMSGNDLVVDCGWTVAGFISFYDELAALADVGASHGCIRLRLPPQPPVTRAEFEEFKEQVFRELGVRAK